MRRTTSVILLLANAAALVLGIWIVLDLVGAHQDKAVVSWFHSAADWLAAWSRGLFSVSSHVGQVLLDYGLPALVYLLIGNLLTRSRVLR
ncbi:membrane protein [Kitasatospora sp. MMS16-BH015]|uniref:hypothetical protein n=1 Tax=Kitasatospora sp. MMS16-BH015 TaxID=2018025 RepID=UPI000CA2C44A|nr:hypothetical protein [Kitasatospora sp. MMS16-BH015]AUG75873.1 membrane protein [Kitasatospora sp. MMS16-BH015]